MRILITTTHVPFIRGGAEIHAENLCRALQQAGHSAEIVSIPFKWYPPERILDNLMACRLLDISESNGVPVDRVIGLKFPAYHIPHPHKVLWILHQYRTAFDLWSAPDGDLINYPNGSELRDAIEGIERQLLPQAQALFANSGNVARRLQNFCQIHAEPLYHPPKNWELLHCSPEKDYFYFPSRLSKLKRQDLVIKALAHCQEPVNIVFSGGADNPAYLESLHSLAREHRVDSRISFEGHVDDETMRRLYAEARAVLFPPIDEDYGYITLEAMFASKPVITCTDSGGPLEFVLDAQTGWVSQPDPQSLARTLDSAWRDHAARPAFGNAGRQRILDMNITWDNVVQKLTS